MSSFQLEIRNTTIMFWSGGEGLPRPRLLQTFTHKTKIKDLYISHCLSVSLPLSFFLSLSVSLSSLDSSTHRTQNYCTRTNYKALRHFDARTILTRTVMRKSDILNQSTIDCKICIYILYTRPLLAMLLPPP